jgi:hypothetical protein
MVGVASERCLDLLTEAYTNAIADPTEQGRFKTKISKARSVNSRIELLRDSLLPKRNKLPEDLRDSLDIQVFDIATVIRRSRNEAGHPVTSTVDRDLAHDILLLFPHFVRRVYELMDFFASDRV